MKAIVNSKVLPVSGEPLSRGTVLFENGRIVAVGKDVTVPDGAEVIDGGGGVLTPGLIDAHTHIGVSMEGAPAEFYDHNDRTSSVQPELRIADSINPADPAFGDARAGGVTTVNIFPGSANVVCGLGAVLKTAGTVVDRMIMKAPSAMKAALGENPIRNYRDKPLLPSTRMGCAAAMRKALADAQNYRMEQKEREEKGLPFHRNLPMEQMALILEREIPLSIHCHRTDDIATAIRIAGEFGVNYTLEHCTEGHLIADYLKEKNVRAAIGPLMISRRKMEVRNMSWELPLALERKGVHFCVITDHPVISTRDLMFTIVMAVSKGLSRRAGLRAVTLSAAEHLGIDDRLGSIEIGKDADLVLWNGDPLTFGSEVETTFIGGKSVYERK